MILDVRDMARQVAFYRDVLGFQIIVPRDDAEDLAQADFVRLETGGALLALHAGTRNGDAPSAARLSLRVSSVERARERLSARGIETGEVRRPAPGVAILDVRDPEGNLVHLEEHAQAPDRRQR